MKLEITNKDFLFGQVVERIITHKCSSALSLFLRETDNCSDRIHDCVFVISIRNRGETIYAGHCSIPHIKSSCKVRSPYFLTVLQKQFSVMPKSQKEAFLIPVSVGISILFSANNMAVPRMSRRFIKNLVYEYRNHLGNFSCWEITSGLDRFNGVWLNELYRLARAQGANTATWRRILLVLGIFWKGMMQPPKPIRNEKDRQELFQAITDLLKKTDEARG